MPSDAVLMWHQMQNVFWMIMVVAVFEHRKCNPGHGFVVGLPP